MQDDLTPLVRIIDDDFSFRESHELLLSLEGFDVVCYENAESFLQSEANNRPGCILLDIRMPGLSGPELQEELNCRGNHLPIIVLTAHADVPTAVVTLKNGALDYIEKQTGLDRLLDMVKKACSQSVEEARNLVIDKELANVYQSLTPRERDVLELFARGFQIKEAARQLNLSPATVKMHRQNAFTKIGAHTSLEAYQWLQEVPEEVRKKERQ